MQHLTLASKQNKTPLFSLYSENTTVYSQLTLTAVLSPFLADNGAKDVVHRNEGIVIQRQAEPPQRLNRSALPPRVFIVFTALHRFPTQAQSQFTATPYL